MSSFEAKLGCDPIITPNLSNREQAGLAKLIRSNLFDYRELEKVPQLGIAAEALQDIFSRTQHIRITPGRVMFDGPQFFSLDSPLHLGRCESSSKLWTLFRNVGLGLLGSETWSG